MDVYEMAKHYYERGLWTVERLEALVKADKLTEEQVAKITGGGSTSRDLSGEEGVSYGR